MQLWRWHPFPMGIKQPLAETYTYRWVPKRAIAVNSLLEVIHNNCLMTSRISRPTVACTHLVMGRTIFDNNEVQRGRKDFLGKIWRLNFKLFWNWGMPPK